MNINKKTQEFAAGITLMIAVAFTGTACEDNDPGYCVWSQWDNKHCGECKEEICENHNGKAICHEVPCHSSEQEPVDEHIKDAQKQIEETKKKSELKSTAPKDICIDNYLGAKYKKGTCEFPVYERMTGRAGLEKKFPSCKINKIIPGKNNTATVKAVCMGVPSIINVKNYKVLQRGSKDGR